MNDLVWLASAMAGAIAMVFLVRFFRQHLAPNFKRARLRQTLAGLAVIIASILGSIWLRRNM